MKKHTCMMLAVAALLMAAMGACTKEPVSGQFSMTVQAAKGSQAPKGLQLDGSTLNAAWRYDFGGGGWINGMKTQNSYVRACLAF